MANNQGGNLDTYYGSQGPWSSLQPGTDLYAGLEHAGQESLAGRQARQAGQAGVYEALEGQISGLGSTAGQWEQLGAEALQSGRTAGARASGDLSRAMLASGGGRNVWGAQQAGLDAARARAAAMGGALAQRGQFLEAASGARAQEAELRSEVAALRRDEETEAQIASNEIALGNEILYGVDGVGAMSHIKGEPGRVIDPMRKGLEGNWSQMYQTVINDILPQMTTQQAYRHWSRYAMWLWNKMGKVGTQGAGTIASAEFAGLGNPEAY